MIGRNKAIIAGVFFSILVLVGAVVAVLVAFKQNTEKPVAPTVPQVTPQAAAPATTETCSLSFKVEPPIAPTHKECKDNACIIVNGTGQDNCPNNCAPTYKYKKCENDACKENDCAPKTTDCSAQSTCSSDTDCKTYTYRVCENRACISHNCDPANKPCDNLISCQTNFDCREITYKHAVCLNTACTSVDCSPPTQQCESLCKNNVDCGYVPPTHKDCRNRACVVVSGAGVDKCTSDVTCQPAAAPPPIPRSGNVAATIGVVVLGLGAVIAGLLILL